MIINLSPAAGNKTTKVSLKGLVLTIDGETFDLSVIPVGGEAKSDLPFVGKVTRKEVSIQYFYDSSTAELNQSTARSDYTFDVISGDVPDPIKRRS